MVLHTYYSERRLLYVSWGSRIDLQGVLKHLELLKTSDHYDRNLLVISSTGVEEIDIPMTEENMLLIRDWRKDALMGYKSIRTACFNLQPVPAAYLTYFSRFFDSPKSMVRQFSDRDSALEWLFDEQVVI